jgi:hypothetical protein
MLLLQVTSAQQVEYFGVTGLKFNCFAKGHRSVLIFAITKVISAYAQVGLPALGGRIQNLAVEEGRFFIFSSFSQVLGPSKSIV